MNNQSTVKFIFNCNDIVELQTFLQQHHELNLTQIKDKQGNNVLHHACFHNQMDMVRLFTVHASRYFQRKNAQHKTIYKKNSKQQLQLWINQPNPQGFTPLLYASYNGNHQLIKFLMTIGANYRCQTLTGLNVLHMGAQNNKVSTFICFCDKISLDSIDKNKSTPLHWACYLGSQDVVAFILSRNDVNINLRDQQGQTPLFQATFYGNTRIVRRILMKGGDRKIANNKGQTPLDISIKNNFTNIKKMLNDQYTCCDRIKFYCNVKTQYKPLKRNLKYPFIFFFTTFFTLFVLNYYLVFQIQYSYVIEGCVFGFLLIIYLTLLIGPHKYPKKQYKDIMMQINRKFCFECMRLPLKRSYHCDICHTCIEQYDHHCTWINNCVGKRNIARFIIFITMLIGCLLLIGIISVLDLFQYFTNRNELFSQYFTHRHQNLSQILIILKVSLMIINVLISLFFFPILLLLGVQIKNLFLNRTTFERFQNKKTNEQNNDSVRQQIQRGQKKISFKNCRLMCSNNKNSISSSNQLQESLNQ